MTVTAAVVGASGYAGVELFRLLVSHPEVKLVWAYDIRNVGKRVSEVHPNLRGLVDMKIVEPDYLKIGKIAKVVFVATPHGIAMKFVPNCATVARRVWTCVRPTDSRM